MASQPSLPGSPKSGGPLNPISPGRANHQREPTFMSSLRSELRDSSVHDKISQFNTLATQSKTLERKTADAALKRAMLGREEAESEMRRYREENKVLRTQLDKAKDREHRVSERLEAVMEQYGRAKETYAHTKAAFEKEIKAARKKIFKNDATIIKLQEEVKAARDGWRTASDHLDEEKARSKKREQEAFEARYHMVALEERLGEALERIKVLEQERDALKTLAQEEEVARIAAEGRIPLPPTQNQDDEFASPRKKRQRVSLSSAEVLSSAAGEEEMEELRRQMHWERRRAERAHAFIDFLQAECHLRTCPAAKHARQKRQSLRSPHRVLVSPREIVNQNYEMALDLAPAYTISPRFASNHPHDAEEAEQTEQTEQTGNTEPTESVCNKPTLPSLKRPREEPRRSTIFCPEEGIFRTVSQEEAEAMQSATQKSSGDDDQSEGPPTPADPEQERMYARTPSVEPPSFALLAQERISLASLLNAPHGITARSSPVPERTTPPSPQGDPAPAAPVYGTETTTTTVPLRDDSVVGPAARFQRSRTPSSDCHESFDVNNPAMTPTISREEALARIRERRGRARSAAQGGVTPRRLGTQSAAGERRDLSAPTGAASSASVPRAISRAAGRVRNVR
ncbi:hypothetical protein SODALDRAFT_315250 [Sodiomyces alkalinus F11]|uniref:Uncharacterized protein n=1 Tax=Sodiomyces alkalinus (strain CBS 110278 / VKM F-3762 / F11) TaxID=1314773 RepID=A0A3N2PPH6_SODAK|nr:hypothetical protein SODALDRAFT_315250 [Sodiomyces alkalinus F11]ROT36403.1 hypothetical protein SODALDRAFT_315250 [Sodiomyces alkalinus F11]